MRDKGDTADRRVAAIAEQHWGVVSSRHLLEAGLTRSGISRRLLAGRLHRVHRGVYAVGHSKLPIEGSWMAALLACGTTQVQPEPEDSTEQNALEVLELWGAALSHRSAAALWRMLPSHEGRVEVSVPGISGKKAHRNVHVHRSRTLTTETVTSHRGIPVTTPARTIADLRLAARTRGCPAGTSQRELRRAIRQAEVLGLVTGAERVTERTRSDLELDFLRLCRRHGLPEPAVNVRIESMRVDFLWREQGLVVETDGYKYHRGRAAFEDDRKRDLRLRALGYGVIRLSEQQVNDEPDHVASVLEGSLRSD